MPISVWRRWQRGAICSKRSILSCPWESFRAEIEAVVLTVDKKSSVGRKPFDAILMFRMLVLQALINLSDEQVEYQVRDRLSFSRFLGLAISIPDATTLWLFRESRSCLTASTSILRPRATWRVAARRQYRAGADAAEQW